jgi:hypothetical protein
VNRAQSAEAPPLVEEALRGYFGSYARGPRKTILDNFDRECI